MFTDCAILAGVSCVFFCSPPPGWCGLAWADVSVQCKTSVAAWAAWPALLLLRGPCRRPGPDWADRVWTLSCELWPLCIQSSG